MERTSKNKVRSAKCARTYIKPSFGVCLFLSSSTTSKGNVYIGIRLPYKKVLPNPLCKQLLPSQNLEGYYSIKICLKLEKKLNLGARARYEKIKKVFGDISTLSNLEYWTWGEDYEAIVRVTITTPNSIRYDDIKTGKISIRSI